MRRGPGAGVGVFVQVRLASERLPGKALLPLAGATLTHHTLRALREVPADVHAVVCDESSRDSLASISRDEGFRIFAGPEHDVLRRYVLAAETFSVDTLVRATGDNPLVSARLAQEIVEIHVEREADLSHYLFCPLGTGVEVIRAAALREADARATDPYEREHMTTHMYRHPDRFLVVEEPCPPEARLEEAKVSVDTQSDYERMKCVFRDLYEGAPIEIERLVRWLKRESSTT